MTKNELKVLSGIAQHMLKAATAMENAAVKIEKAAEIMANRNAGRASDHTPMETQTQMNDAFTNAVIGVRKPRPLPENPVAEEDQLIRSLLQMFPDPDHPTRIFVESIAAHKQNVGWISNKQFARLTETWNNVMRGRTPANETYPNGTVHL